VTIASERVAAAARLGLATRCVSGGLDPALESTRDGAGG